MSRADLERRYRRLLAWYPRSHRRVYEDEMVAVLVAGAQPGQRRPTLSETADLIASGLRARTWAAVAGLARPAWVDAAGVFGLLTALVLLSQRIVRLLAPVLVGTGAVAEPQQYLRAAGWGAVVLAILVGLRRPAAGLAWITVLGEALLVGRYYESAPVSAISLFVPLTLGVTAAAVLTVPAPPQHFATTDRRHQLYSRRHPWLRKANHSSRYHQGPLSVLRIPRLLMFVAGLVLVHAILLLNRRAEAWYDSGTSYVFYGLENRSEVILNLWLMAIAAGALAAGLAGLTLPAAVRWRITALAAPVVTLAVVVKLTRLASSSGYIGHQHLTPAQWALLVATPLATFGLAALLVHRREHMNRLAALGRAADTEHRHATG